MRKPAASQSLRKDHEVIVVSGAMAAAVRKSITRLRRLPGWRAGQRRKTFHPMAGPAGRAIHQRTMSSQPIQSLNALKRHLVRRQSNLQV
jgi:hypothetical protein